MRRGEDGGGGGRVPVGVEGVAGIEHLDGADEVDWRRLDGLLEGEEQSSDLLLDRVQEEV